MGRGGGSEVNYNSLDGEWGEGGRITRFIRWGVGGGRENNTIH